MLLSGKNPDELEKMPQGNAGPAQQILGLYWMYGPRMMNKLAARMDMTLSEETRAELIAEELNKGGKK